ncbi:MAG: hypothetical protein AVDCRST_MAG07-3103, partial [uncultured Frankineae bacterium]
WRPASRRSRGASGTDTSSEPSRTRRPPARCRAPPGTSGRPTEGMSFSRSGPLLALTLPRH